MTIEEYRGNSSSTTNGNSLGFDAQPPPDFANSQRTNGRARVDLTRIHPTHGIVDVIPIRLRWYRNDMNALGRFETINLERQVFAPRVW